MKTLFNAIRRQSLSDNKLSKYLLYAIGEIILVMIGILLALQVNNWNEQRKTKQTEQALLRAIHQETKNNLSALNKEREDLSKTLINQRKLIAYIDEDISTINEKELSTIINRAISQEVVFNFQSGVLTELINSGELKIISNDSIQSILAGFDQHIGFVKDQEKELLSYRNKLAEYFIHTGDMRRMFDDIGVSEGLNQSQLAKKNQSNKVLLADQVFENYLAIYLTVGAVLEKHQYPTIKEKLETLLHLIEEELK